MPQGKLQSTRSGPGYLPGPVFAPSRAVRTVAQEGKGSLVKELEALCAAAQNWTLLKNHCEGRSLGTREIKGKGSQELFEVTGVK